MDVYMSMLVNMILWRSLQNTLVLFFHVGNEFFALLFQMALSPDCPVCQQNGLQGKLRRFHINFEESITLCANEKVRNDSQSFDLLCLLEWLSQIDCHLNQVLIIDKSKRHVFSVIYLCAWIPCFTKRNGW